MGVAIAGAVISAVGVATQIYGQVSGSRAAKKQAEYNQYLGRVAAQDARIRGQDTETSHRFTVGQLIGRQRAATGASGVEIGEGSTAEVEADTLMAAELDALRIRNMAERQAWGLEVGMVQFQFEEQAAYLQGTVGAFGTALVGTGQILSSYRPQQNTFNAGLTVPARSTNSPGSPLSAPGQAQVGP